MTSERLKIFLHIGQPKTGSTAIQSLLNSNREFLLQKYDIHYPCFHMPERKEGPPNNADLFVHAFRIKEEQLVIDEISKEVNHCKNSGIGKLLISSETLFAWKTIPAFFGDLVKKMDIDIEIIVYLRRQDNWLESGWRQWGVKNPRLKTIQDYEKRMPLNWYDILSGWLKFFDKSQFIVRVYEKERIKDDVVGNFMNILHIDSMEGFSIPVNNNFNRNPQFNRAITGLMYHCRTLFDNIQDNTLTNHLINILPEKYLKPDPGKSNRLLAPAERLAIIHKYEDSNRQVLHTFFGPDRSSLFMEALPDPNEKWEPEAEYPVEKIVPIFMDIFIKQNEEIQKLKKNINKLRDDFNSLTTAENREFTTIDIGSVYNDSQFNSQITNLNLTDTGIEFFAESSDPYFVMPKFNQTSVVKTIRIDLTVPCETTLQLFYCTAFFGKFNEQDSVKKQLHEGRNIVNIEIPPTNKLKKLRLDPGCHPGNYIIHEIKTLAE